MMNTLEAIALLKQNSPSDLSAEDLASLSEAIQRNPTICQAVGGIDVVQRYLADATAAVGQRPNVSDQPVVDEFGEAANTKQPPRKLRRSIELLVFIILAGGAVYGIYHFIFAGGAEQPPLAKSIAKPSDPEVPINVPSPEPKPIKIPNAKPATRPQAPHEELPSQAQTDPNRAWQGWDIHQQEGAFVGRKHQWDLSDPSRPRPVELLITQGNPWTLSREIDVSDQTKWLILLATRSEEMGVPPKLIVRINGEPVAQFDVPLRGNSPSDIQPLIVPLRNYLGKRVKIEMTQNSEGRQTPITWDAIRLTPTPPSLVEVFEESGVLSGVDGKPTTAKITDTDHHAGQRAIRIDAPDRVRLAPHGASAVRIRRLPAIGEYRYLRLAFRKYGGGRFDFELQHDLSSGQPVRYEAGGGGQSDRTAKRIWHGKLPEEWIVVDRDLFSDFGNINVSGLTLAVPDGSHAMVDHVYFARTLEDFRLLPEARSPEETNKIARTALSNEILAQAIPATVAIGIGDRWGTGVAISADGYVLTAGHTLAGHQGDVTVHWVDGKTTKAKALGIARAPDIGLIKVVGSGSWPHVKIGQLGDSPDDQFYVALTYPSKFLPGQRPENAISQFRRFVLGSVWTTFDREDYSTGGPLLSPLGELVGIQTRRSRFGGLIYSPTRDLAGLMPALERGEMIGRWSAGVGPMIGAYITSGENGCSVSKVFADSHAARAGIRVGDIVRKVDGKTVETLVDIYEQLAGKNPGEQVQFEVKRGAETLPLSIQLMPRSP